MVVVVVVAEEEAKLERLENQVDNGGGGAWEYLCLVRKLNARRSDKVLKHGISVLNNSTARSKLGTEEWTLYEQVAVAAMDCQRIDIEKDCIVVLSKKFPGSTRVGRLEAMLLEAKGAWEDAEKAYARLLEDNPLDQVIHKRKVAMAKAQGNASAAVEFLNKYLEIFMADHDAWRELAEIYVSLQMYKQAAFCYEELILCQPLVPPYHLAYAESLILFYEMIKLGSALEHNVEKSVEKIWVLYTMGGLENLQAAKKYYASTINLTGGKNTRALYGVCLCSVAINQLTKGRNKAEESSQLQSLAAQALLKDYKQRAPGKLPLLTATLRNMKLVE